MREAFRRGWPEVQPLVPKRVRVEVERYLRCGDVRFGFVEVRCEACREAKLVALRCRGRGGVRRARRGGRLRRRCSWRRSCRDSYDGQGRLVEAVATNPTGVSDGRRTWTYTNSGALSEESTLDLFTLGERRVSYAYDDGGRCEGVVFKAPDVMQSLWVHLGLSPVYVGPGRHFEPTAPLAL